MNSSIRVESVSKKKRSCLERVEIAKLLNFRIIKLINFFKISP